MRLVSLQNSLYKKFELEEINVIFGGKTTEDQDSTCCGEVRTDTGDQTYSEDGYWWCSLPKDDNDPTQ